MARATRTDPPGATRSSEETGPDLAASAGSRGQLAIWIPRAGAKTRWFPRRGSASILIEIAAAPRQSVTVATPSARQTRSRGEQVRSSRARGHLTAAIGRGERVLPRQSHVATKPFRSSGGGVNPHLNSREGTGEGRTVHGSPCGLRAAVGGFLSPFGLCWFCDYHVRGLRPGYFLSPLRLGIGLKTGSLKLPCRNGFVTWLRRARRHDDLDVVSFSPGACAPATFCRRSRLGIG